MNRGKPTRSALRTVRRAAGMVQAALSKRSGVPQPTISRIEHGQTPSLVHATMLSRALGTSIEALFGELIESGSSARCHVVVREGFDQSPDERSVA